MEKNPPPDDGEPASEDGQPSKIPTEYVDFTLTASAKARRKEALLPKRNNNKGRSTRKSVQFESRAQVIETTTVTPLDQARRPSLGQDSSRASSAELGNYTITKLPFLGGRELKRATNESSKAGADGRKQPVKCQPRQGLGSTTSIEEKMSQTIRVKRGDKMLLQREKSVPDIYSKSAIDKFIEDNRIEFNRRGAYVDKFHLNYIRVSGQACI